MEKIRIMITIFSKNPAEPSFSLLRGLFPVCELCSEPGLQVLQPAPGIVLQLVNPGAQPPTYLSAATGAVINYAVGDLQKAINNALEQGATVLGHATDNATGFAFCYLQFPGGQPFGFFTP